MTKDWVVEPTRDAVPLPVEGAVVPVLAVPSGIVLLKFHWAMTAALAVLENAMTPAVTITRENSCFMVVD